MAQIVSLPGAAVSLIATTENQSFFAVIYAFS